MEDRRGTGLPTVKPIAFEVPPPGVGFTTVSFTVPMVPRSDPGTIEVTLVALTYEVVSAVWPQYTCELDTNPDPFTVSVKELPDCGALVGETDVMEGAGFCWSPPPPPPPFPPPPPQALSKKKGTNTTACRSAGRDGFMARIAFLGKRAKCNTGSVRADVPSLC